MRVTRGLSVDAEVNASRIRDQLSLPARGASAEEILLRLRRLQSGYEYQFGISVTYTFGSIFSSIVNPRFGQWKLQPDCGDSEEFRFEVSKPRT